MEAAHASLWEDTGSALDVQLKRHFYLLVQARALTDVLTVLTTSTPDLLCKVRKELAEMRVENQELTAEIDDLRNIWKGESLPRRRKAKCSHSPSSEKREREKFLDADMTQVELVLTAKTLNNSVNMLKHFSQGEGKTGLSSSKQESRADLASSLETPPRPPAPKPRAQTATHETFNIATDEEQPSSAAGCPDTFNEERSIRTTAASGCPDTFNIFMDKERTTRPTADPGCPDTFSIFTDEEQSTKPTAEPGCPDTFNIFTDEERPARVTAAPGCPETFNIFTDEERFMRVTAAPGCPQTFNIFTDEERSAQAAVPDASGIECSEVPWPAPEMVRPRTLEVGGVRSCPQTFSIATDEDFFNDASATAADPELSLSSGEELPDLEPAAPCHDPWDPTEELLLEAPSGSVAASQDAAQASLGTKEAESEPQVPPGTPEVELELETMESLDNDLDEAGMSFRLGSSEVHGSASPASSFRTAASPPSMQAEMLTPQQRSLRGTPAKNTPRRSCSSQAELSAEEGWDLDSSTLTKQGWAEDTLLLSPSGTSEAENVGLLGAAEAVQDAVPATADAVQSTAERVPDTADTADAVPGEVDTVLDTADAGPDMSYAVPSGPASPPDTRLRRDSRGRWLQHIQAMGALKSSPKPAELPAGDHIPAPKGERRKVDHEGKPQVAAVPEAPPAHKEHREAHREAHREPYDRSSSRWQVGPFEFFADFDCANCMRVAQTPQRDEAVDGMLSFDVMPRPDPKEKQEHSCLWFYFGMRGPVTRGSRLRFRLTGLSPLDPGSRHSFLADDFKPVINTSPPGPSFPSKWRPVSGPTKLAVTASGEKAFVFDHVVEHEANENWDVFFALTYPYSLRDLLRTQQQVRNLLEDRNNYIHVRSLTSSARGHPLKLWLVTGPDSSYKQEPGVPTRSHLFPQRRAIFIRARAHPGEAPSSYMLQGILDYLASGEAQLLLSRYVLYIIPAIDPDGIALGRTRYYERLSTHEARASGNAASRAACEVAHRRQGGVRLFLDLRADWERRGMFIRGDSERGGGGVAAAQLFGYALSRRFNLFEYEQCSFTDSRPSERSWAGKLTGSPLCFSLESSYGRGHHSPHDYTPEDWKALGRSSLESLLDLDALETPSPALERHAHFILHDLNEAMAWFHAEAEEPLGGRAPKSPSRPRGPSRVQPLFAVVKSTPVSQVEARLEGKCVEIIEVTLEVSVVDNNPKGPRKGRGKGGSLFSHKLDDFCRLHECDGGVWLSRGNLDFVSSQKGHFVYKALMQVPVCEEARSGAPVLWLLKPGTIVHVDERRVVEGRLRLRVTAAPHTLANKELGWVCEYQSPSFDTRLGGKAQLMRMPMKGAWG